MAKKEIFLEESVLDDLSEGLDIIERPLSEKVFAFLGWATVLVVVVIFGRVAWAQILSGQVYESRALANSGQQTILKAPRGIIYDRNGKVLVSNESSFSVILNLSELLKDGASLDGVLSQISNIVPFDVAVVKQEILSVDLEHQAYLPLAQNTSLSEVIDLKKLNFKSVVVENSYIRQYIDGPIFSHIIGYTGLVSRKDLDENKNLNLNDEIGKSGLEAKYDSYLSGKNGVAVSYQDAKGDSLGNKTINNPVGGDAVYTTLDADLQNYFYNAMKDQMVSLGRVTGAGLIINPQTGEVLSMISFPSFDNNNLTSQIFVDKNKPTFNRVISGLYSPGSTIKPLVAFGVLEENIIDPLKQILSIGYIDIPNPYYPEKPSRFLDWKPQGWVNLYSALARSSNIYFYEVGGGYQDQQGLGISRLIDYWKKFEIDKPTGVDLPGEVSGILADPQKREEQTGQIWRVGDTYNVVIGQGDLRITPIELLRYISSIADKGKTPIPYIVGSIKNSQSYIVYQARPEFTSVEAKDPNHFDEIEKGMLDGVSKDYGTSYSLHDIPMAIAAKTGSAQIQNNQKTNAFFVGYGPVPNPQIAVLILIEDAKEGSLNTVPVAKKVFEWYYENRIKKQK
jgi:penicillin-binding protein 2